MKDPTQDTPYSRRLGGEASYWTMGYLMTWLAEGKDTGGCFSLVDVVVPKGTEPPPHTHSREDEAYYILEGEITFQVGRRADHRGHAGRLYMAAARHRARPAAQEPAGQGSHPHHPGGIGGSFQADE